MPQGGTRVPFTPASLRGLPPEAAQPDAFSPGEPTVPAFREALRLWDFPVGVNTVYEPRNNEPISFAELRALADSHDITRLAIETRKDQLEKLDWTIKPLVTRRSDGESQTRAARLAEFWRRPDGAARFATWLRALLKICWFWMPRPSNCAAIAAARSSASTSSMVPRSNCCS